MTGKNYTAYLLLHNEKTLYVGSGTLVRPERSLRASHVPFIMAHRNEITIRRTPPTFYGKAVLQEFYLCAKHQPRFNKNNILALGRDYYLAYKLNKLTDESIFHQRLTNAFDVCEKSLKTIQNEFLDYEASINTVSKIIGVENKPLTYEDWLKEKLNPFLTMTYPDYKDLLIETKRLDYLKQFGDSFLRK